MEDWQILSKTVGENIVRLRMSKNLRQIDLATLLNIEDSSLRRIESGRTNPTLKTLCKIAKALDVKVQELLR